MREFEGKTYKAIITGTDARTLRDSQGRRAMGPCRVKVPMMMSPIFGSQEAMDICLYVDNPERAIHAAAEILKRFYKGDSMASEGYPKPHGEGTLELLEDKEFKALYRDAQREASRGGHDIRTLGPKDDPTAFHVIKQTKKIILN